MMRLSGILLAAGLLAAGALCCFSDYGWMPPPKTSEGKPAIMVKRQRDVFGPRTIPKDEGSDLEENMVLVFPSTDDDPDEPEEEVVEPPAPPEPPPLPVPPPDDRRKPPGAHERLGHP